MARRAGYDACSWRAQSSSDPGQDRALASNLEEPRPVGKLLPAWRSRSLHRQVRRLLQPPTLSGIAPCFVELCEAVVAVNDVRRPSQFGKERDCCFLFVVSGKREPQCRKLLVSFEPAKAFLDLFMAASVQRKAVEDELQRFTLRVTRCTVPIIFSMMLVQASERRNSAGRPRSLLTVRISSNP